MYRNPFKPKPPYRKPRNKAVRTDKTRSTLKPSLRKFLRSQ